MPIFFTLLYTIVNFVGINSLILSPTRPFSFVLLQIASAYFQDHIHIAATIDAQRYSLATIFQRVHLPCCRCAPAQRRSSASLDSSVPHSDGHSGTQAAAAGQGAQLLQAGFHRPFSAVLSDTPVSSIFSRKTRSTRACKVARFRQQYSPSRGSRTTVWLFFSISTVSG